MIFKPKGHKTRKGSPMQMATDFDSFKLTAESRKQLNAVTNAAREAIKAHYTSPVELAAFIESHQTPVYVLNQSMLGGLSLAALGFESGFILPDEGRRFEMLKKLLLSHAERPGRHQASDDALAQGLPHGVVVLTRPLFTVGFLSHQLHHWLACRSGLQGYSERAKQLYRHFWQRNGRLGQEVFKMSLEDVQALKDAINRDLEALRFLRAITDEVFIPAQQARRLASGYASA